MLTFKTILQEITVHQSDGWLFTVHPENPDEVYFKLYDDPNFWKARKVARISFKGPKYFKFNESRNRKQWYLTNSEKHTLKELLNQEDSGLKLWNKLIIAYNKEILRGKNKNLGFIPLPLNLEIPDYLKLDGGEK